MPIYAKPACAHTLSSDSEAVFAASCGSIALNFRAERLNGDGTIVADTVENVHQFGEWNHTRFGRECSAHCRSGHPDQSPQVHR